MSQQGSFAEAAEHYLKAIDLYRGDFLPESPYEDWIVSERSRLEAEYIKDLEWLSEHAAQAGDHQAATRYCRLILDRDPLREDVHRRLMLSLARSGSRSEAIKQYNTFRRILHEELGICPSGETVALAKAIMAGEDV